MLNTVLRYPVNRANYGAPSAAVHWPAAIWWDKRWQELPAHRNDLAGDREYSLRLQWAGHLNDVRKTLLESGWGRPPSGAADLLQWFRSGAAAEQIPVLPQVHAGREDSLRLTRRGPRPDRLLALRLWATDVILAGDAQRVPLWIGSMTYLEPSYPLGLSMLRTVPDETVPMEELGHRLADGAWQIGIRCRPAESENGTPIPVKLIAPGSLGLPESQGTDKPSACAETAPSGPGF